MTVFAGIVIACFVVVSYYWSLWQGGEAVFISAAEAVPVPSLSLPDPQIMQQADTGSFPAGKQHCLACHEGIEPARPLQSGMMQAILAKGASMGDRTAAWSAMVETRQKRLIASVPIAELLPEAGSPLLHPYPGPCR